MKSIIEVSHLSKKYKYGESQPYYTLRDILMDVAKNPFRIFRKNQQTTNLKKDEFWALKNVSFSVSQGDVVGIIGPNGSGKSTLLKILSRITPPTSGEVILRGRVGSLLEVGTGFQQELTGRENIYLNGAILGMSRREVNRKFDEIVDFSGVEKFLDTPVKHYSSGMYMRLAFAVAAHLESEILLVDEVLAVGDVQFQKKCLGKMSEVSKQGRTVLFVSHNMGAIKQLCKQAILLDAGTIKYSGNTELVIEKYIDSSKALFNQVDIRKKLKKLPIDPIFQIKDINLEQDGKNINNYIVENGKDFEIIIEYSVKEIANNLRLYVDVCNKNDDLIFRSYSDDYQSSTTVLPGNYFSKIKISKGLLGPINYLIKINSGIYNVRNCIPYGELYFGIKVENTSGYNKFYPDSIFSGYLGILLEWTNTKTK